MSHLCLDESGPPHISGATATLDEGRRGARRGGHGIPGEAPEAGRDDAMAAITIPDSVKRYFPQALDPTHLWVNYNPKADALTVYFTAHPVPSVWEDIDRYVYIGFAANDERRVTGVMIEHFSQWLLVEEFKEGA